MNNFFVGSLVKGAVLFASFSVLNACAESSEKEYPAKGVLETQVLSGEILPYYVVFGVDGTPEVRGVSVGDGGARVVDIRKDEFPIEAKIKRIETLTFVTYEGSCEIAIPTKTGYKKVVIQNDALCAQIKP